MVTSAARLAPGHDAHPKGMMPCPMPVFWGGCVALRADRKWAPQMGCNPKTGILQGRDTGDTQGPFPGGRLGDGRKPHHAWEDTMASRDVPGGLSCGMEEPVLFWHSPLPSRDSRARLEMGTAGPAVTTGAARGCHWHKAVPVWGQTHARKPPIGAGGHNWATRPCRAQEEGLRGQLLNFCGDL